MSIYKNEKFENNFKYHEVKPGQQSKYESIRNIGKNYAYTIDGLVPDGREKDIAMQKLEECVMWANAGIARQGDK